MDDQGHAASQEPSAEGTRSPEDPASSQAAPIPGSGRDRRADGLREVLTSRGAGWAVAAAMTGAVVGLSVAMATSATPTAMVRPEAQAGLRGAQADATRAPAGGGVVRALAPARAQVPARLQVPAGVPPQAPARLRLQVPAGVPLRAPARLRLQIPARPTAQAPARLRAVTPIPAARVQAAPGPVAPVAVSVPRTLHLRVRPAQVRVRLRIPASARSQARPGPVRAMVPGPRAAAVLPGSGGTPARLRIVFLKGEPVPARLLLPANLRGQARLRIQIPARARLTPASPAPPAG